jgi:MFS family permease
MIEGCSLLTIVTGAWLMDKWGRRPMILFGFAGCFCCLVVVAVNIAIFASPIPANPNKAAMGTVVAMLYVLPGICDQVRSNP